MNGRYFIGAVILQPIHLGGGGGAGFKQNICQNPQFLKIFFFLKQYDCESIRTIIFSARK